jgi:formylglycine-generating enzyme required for sulfatase activity
MLVLASGCGLFLAVAVVAAHDGEPDPMDKVLKVFAEEFVSLTPGVGKFPAALRMSSGDDGQAAEKGPVRVTFKAPFALARYEVTQELYETVMGRNPSRWKGRRNSVEMVSWDEANDFCRKATTLLKKRKLIGEGDFIRLPSEAEWEYACRAGTTTAYCFGDDPAELREYGWFAGNSKGEDPPVGRKKPNAWGLFDMHGYVWEWCADAWAPSLEGIPADGSPRAEADARERVLRGGSWADAPERCRCGSRHHAPAAFRADTVGFRCVKAAASKKSKEDSR